MVMLIPTFIMTDLFLYKPVLVTEALSYIIVWCLFVFGKSVLVQQVGFQMSRTTCFSSSNSSMAGLRQPKLPIHPIFMLKWTTLSSRSNL
ncbi:MAG: hypothetical protein DI548_02875 [Flavobacterium johnsoniae]|nr:MAG: hypothetical protein DI548_02875 [Flavobacterium johnsoniae]